MFRSGLILLTFWGLASATGIAADESGERREPTVGAEGRIEQIVLPGSELTGKDLVEGAPLVVRVSNVFPHGDSYRYDLQFFGFEPGNYDLSKYLERKDGSSTDGLPVIDVRIRSLLPPGQIEPNPLEKGWLPRLGGYKVVASLMAALWFGVLLYLIFGGRKSTSAEDSADVQLTLADLLMPRLTEALDNKMEPSQYAELERMLFAYWRKRLQLESDSAEQALTKIHANPESGPLMRQLEQWMHNPARDPNVNLAQLLVPYEKLPADTAGFEL